MEDVIFSGTSNKPSKNIAEVSISLTNQNNDGPHQYKDLDQIEIRRKIEKDKGLYLFQFSFLFLFDQDLYIDVVHHYFGLLMKLIPQQYFLKVYLMFQKR